MKAMSKSELAMKAGVSVTTLMKWCRPFQQELKLLGMQPNMRVLPPCVVEFIADKLSIDV